MGILNILRYMMATILLQCIVGFQSTRYFYYAFEHVQNVQTPKVVHYIVKGIWF